MQSAFFNAVRNRLRPYATGLFPDPPAKPSYPGEIYPITTRAWGSHSQGNYVMAVLPERAVPDRPTVILYLHGFTFCNPYFYAAHLQHLAKQGAYVFFVDYQSDQFPDTQTPEPPSSDWTTSAQFLAAALESFQMTGEAMITNAAKAVQAAMAVVFPQSARPDLYLFGHSVGGLFALSWPFFNGVQGIKGILAADPIPATASLPSWLLEGAREAAADVSTFPFLAQPVKASQTGQGLNNIPVALLIGNSDLFVNVSDWQRIWPCLATDNKRIYLSQTDNYYGIYRCDAQRALTAYHNQSVTNTLFYGADALQGLIGGAGLENDLRWRCVWAALDAMLAGARADQLTFDMGAWSNGKRVKGVQAWPRRPR
jgi:hypothetical protein